VLEAVRRSTDYYSELFGRPEEVGYTVIEIPNGWGSQASDYYFLQSAAAFEDPKRISEVYHEIGHGLTSMQPPRPGRASIKPSLLFESLAVRHFDVSGLQETWSVANLFDNGPSRQEVRRNAHRRLRVTRNGQPLLHRGLPFVLHQDRRRRFASHQCLRQQSRAGGLDFTPSSRPRSA
jgi:hypothetical protein